MNVHSVVAVLWRRLACMANSLAVITIRDVIISLLGVGDF